MKRIHVNQNVIRHNNKYDNKLPAIRIEENGKKAIYCQEVVIPGGSQLVYRPDAPLSCGAKLWLETESELLIIGGIDYATIRKQMEEITK